MFDNFCSSGTAVVASVSSATVTDSVAAVPVGVADIRAVVVECDVDDDALEVVVGCVRLVEVVAGTVVLETVDCDRLEADERIVVSGTEVCVRFDAADDEDADDVDATDELVIVDAPVVDIDEDEGPVEVENDDCDVGVRDGNPVAV